MTAEEIIRNLSEVEQRSRSNTRRIDRLEKDNEALNRLATSVEVLATKQDNVAEQVEKINGKVTALEKIPGERWKNLIGYLTAALCSAGITALIAVLWK